MFSNFMKNKKIQAAFIEDLNEELFLGAMFSDKEAPIVSK